MANASAAPIVVPPSEAWDGNDGPWSTFNIHVGTPPQPARVLISTAMGETWTISANKTQGGCLSTDDSTCPSARGALINVNTSSTWQDQGIYALGLELNLPDYVQGYDNGDYGLDVLGVGLPGSNGAQLDNMVVAVLATKDYYLGYLGVTPYPTNFTTFNDPHTSFLSGLRQQNKIPSLSYGYSAGAQYRLKKVLGTLTLGGYDASRFEANDVSFGFATDISRDLVVGLQSITFNDANSTNEALLPEGILTFIDATVPHIWLPQSACTLFESAFGITYDSTVNRYLVNDTLHQKLQSQNASVSFILGNSVSGGTTVNITLPYAAFDLEIGPPYVNTTQNYFPLRQAANETQYTLGRTFLQEAYLIVDYERSNFSVSQNTWIENTPQQIETIAPAPNATSPITKTYTKSHKLSTGAIVGIAVAAVVLVILLIVAAIFEFKRRSKKRKAGTKKVDEDSDPMHLKPEMDGSGKPPLGELYSDHKFNQSEEMDSSSRIEVEGDDPNHPAHEKTGVEMEGARLRAEMEGSRGGAEMEGNNVAPVELDADPNGLLRSPSPHTSNSELPSPVSPDQENMPLPFRMNKDRVPSPLSRNVDRGTDGSSGTQRPQGALKSPKGSSNMPPESPDRKGDANLWNSRVPKDMSKAPRSHDVSPGNESSRGGRTHGFNARDIQPQPLSREVTPAETSSPTRERQRNRGQMLDRRLESTSRSATPLIASSPSSPSTSSRERLPPSGHEEWNRRFGTTPRHPSPRTPEISSPSDSERERRRVGRATPNISSPENRSPPSESPKPPGNFF